MADNFYTHRLTKLLEDFVIAAGMTVHISDEASSVKLKEHLSAIKAVADSVGVESSHRSEDGVTVVRLKRK